MGTRVKICGITRLEDARFAVDAGADALGLNFWPKSPRRCAPDVAARVVEALGHRVRLVGVTVDATADEIARVRGLGVRWIQLHGDEPDALLTALLPEAFRAVHVTDAASRDRARSALGAELLLDARTAAMPGGTGQTCDWSLAREVALERPIWLAGGLTPENVADAVTAVRPHGVDVASGVERAPGVKDRERVRAFIEAAKGGS